MTSGLGSERMESWGWRIPFPLAVPLGITGIHFRKHIGDTPNFTRLKEEDGLSKNPLKEAFTSAEHRRAMLPDAALVERLGAFSSATIHEAQGRLGALDSVIKPVDHRMSLCGPPSRFSAHRATT